MTNPYRLVASVLACLLALPSAARAQATYETLYTFTGFATELGMPYGAFIETGDGYLYGTSQYGGAFGLGTVYRMTREGEVTILHSFTGKAGGTFPMTAVVRGTDGYFYGTTLYGGAQERGTIYRIAPDGGNFTVLHEFAGFPTGGAYPYAPLIQATDGNFYGVTFGGGAYGSGALYRMTPAGSVTILHSFGLSTPQSPFGALVQAGDGHLYGTTRFGGIFRMTLAGDLTVLHQMDAATEGATVNAPLVEGPDGNLYGAAREGGATNGGTIFRITPAGVVTVIHTFTGGVDGDAPEAGLILAPDGNFYGTTVGGYQTDGGARVFRITPGGSLTVLHSFGADERRPHASLLLAGDGRLYGTTTGPRGSQLAVAFRVTTGTLTLDRTGLYFGGTNAGGLSVTGPQTVTVTPPAGLGWTASSNVPWLQVSPSSGTGNTVVTISIIDPGGLPYAGTLTGAVEFRPSIGTVATLPVTLTLSPMGGTSAPVGSFDTPVDGATGVTGPISVTGWALDDVEVTAVSICRDAATGESANVDGRCNGLAQIYIADAVFVEGARPDVEAYFPTTPLANRAGWGYQLLTNFLPGQGNGIFRIHAYAYDREGRSTNLGFKTITVENAGASLPFGTIDTPGQGETVSGIVNNFGWVLAKAPNRADPPGGGTVTVYIDNIAVGSPSGWTSRPDIVALFPAAEYPGVDTAAGVFTFDSRTLSNGLHTIHWIVTDNMGTSAGIGSRYFRVFNP